MNTFPVERQDAAEALGGPTTAVCTTFAHLAHHILNLVRQPQGNPFAPFGERYPTMAEWEITANDQAKYKGIFQNCNPVDGIIGGDVAKVH